MILKKLVAYRMDDRMTLMKIAPYQMNRALILKKLIVYRMPDQTTLTEIVLYWMTRYAALEDAVQLAD